ncbi:MAG: MFS transporter [Armatimonadota bacterium]
MGKAEELLRKAAGRRDLLLFASVVFAAAFGFTLYETSFSNFVVQKIGVQPGQYGLLESLREVPGLLTAFVMGLLVSVAEPRLAAAALLIGGIGIGALSRAHTFPQVVAYSVFWSLGMHLWFTLSPSLTLKLARERAEGRRMGQMSAVGSVAVLTAIASVRLVSRHAPYEALFLTAGGCLALSAFLCSRVSAKLGTPDRPKLLFRRRYALYYVLVFLDGCRRQVFGTFAMFALVREFHTGLGRIADLRFLNTAAVMVAAPIAGLWIDRIGERKLLCANYLVLSMLFVGYAFTPWIGVLYALYFVDNVLFVFSMALTTYLKRIAPPEDVTPSLAMATTINHIAAVIVPLAGGYLWQAFGYRVPFLVGSGMVLLSLTAALRIPEREPVTMLKDKKPPIPTQTG